MAGFVAYKHPEIKDDEFLLSNVKIGEEWQFGFFGGEKTTNNGRLGKIALDSMGYVVHGQVPVFVKKEI